MGTKQIKAFSLIEISVVLLIVAIFVAAISSGKLLLDKSNDIRLQRGLQAGLESQEYYSHKSFEVNTKAITDGCGANPSANAISDFLYTQIARSTESGKGGCCSDGENLESLCCNKGPDCEVCGGGPNQPECLVPDS